MINFINRESELAQLETQYAADSGSAFAQEKSVIFDVKGILPLGAADGRL
jgi:hypothetical protein